MKKFLSFLIFFVMLLLLTVSAFADDAITLYAPNASGQYKAVTVTEYSTAQIVDPDEAEDLNRESFQLRTDSKPNKGVLCTWTSSNEDVAKCIPGSGLYTRVKAFQNGETTITATDASGNTKSIKVVVNATPIQVTYYTTKGGTVYKTGIAYNYVAIGARVLELPGDPSREGYAFDGWYYDFNGEKAFNTAVRFTIDTTVYAKWTPTYTVGNATYNTLNDALENAAEQTEITIPEDVEAVALDDAATLTVPAGGTVKVESKAADGAASAKVVTIKSGSTTETAYLVTVGGATSAVKSNAVDNVITGKDTDGGTISTEAEAKAAVAKMFDVPKTLAAIASKAGSAVTDVDFSMKVDGNVTQKNEKTKTFEVHPIAKYGDTEIEVPANARIAKEYNVTLPFGAANKGKYAKITHYKSDTETEELGIYPIDASGNATFPMTSFSPVEGEVIDTPEDGATFTLTVDAPDTIDVDTEFEVAVKLTSSVDTQISTMKFSYSLPANFEDVGKTKTLGKAEPADGAWLWQAAAEGNDYIALTADTPLSLGTIKAKVAKANAEYNVGKTFTFNAATLTLVNGANADATAYKTYQTTAASDTTKVTTTYTITWNYNGGKVGNDTSKTDTVGVNVTPTAPAPVKPGYNLSGWDPTVDKATANVTYKAKWTLKTDGMSVAFNDYGYAYLNGADYDKLLVLKAPAPESGYAYAIDGNLMFATTEANYRALVSAADNETVYVYLVDSATTSPNVLTDATPKLSVVEGTNETIARDGDLNRDSNVQQGDLGVLVDLFKNPGIYTRDGVVGVRARLEADMNNEANAASGFKSIADVNALIGKLFPASGG